MGRVAFYTQVALAITPWYEQIMFFSQGRWGWALCLSSFLCKCAPPKRHGGSLPTSILATVVSTSSCLLRRLRPSRSTALVAVGGGAPRSRVVHMFVYFGSQKS
ncbi:unnamed protein product [Pylaiella littoralis]